MIVVTRNLVALLLLIVLAGCQPGENVLSHGTHGGNGAAPTIFRGEYPIQVVCTTGQVTEMLTRLGGEHVNVSGLMGPGIDPHLYRAVPADVQMLERADLIAYNGLHLEGKMTGIFENLGRRKAVWAVTDGLVEAKDPRLRRPPQFEGAYDPHVWHDAMMWADCVKYVAERLAEFDPPHAAEYEQSSEAYLAEMQEADAFCRERIATIPADQRVLVTAHDAFEYFSATYGLESHALKGISTDDEVSIGRMDEVIDLLVERKVRAVFVETAVAHRIVEALIEPCRARGHDVALGGELYADAMGPPGSGAETYLGMIKANVTTIVSALGGQAEIEPE